jgi:hypothetical protein
LFKLKSLVTILPTSVRASSISLRSTSFDLGKVDVGDDDLDAGHLLDLLENVEAAAAAVALHRIRGIGDELQFLEDELRNHQRAVDEAGLAEVGDAAIDDHRGVENLVVALGPCGAKQGHQPRRLEPLTLAPADDQAEVREDQQDEAMQERDALVAVIDPEQRGADALGQQESGGAADKGAEHVSDGGVAQLPLEDHRHHREGDTEGHVEHRVGPQRLQHEGGVRDGAHKREARDYEPGHI